MAGIGLPTINYMSMLADKHVRISDNFYILKLVCEFVPYSAQVEVNNAIAWIPRIPHHKIRNNKPFFNRPKLAFKKRNVRTLTLALIRDYLIKRSIDGFLFLNSPKKAQELFSLQVSTQNEYYSSHSEPESNIRNVSHWSTVNALIRSSS